MTALRGQAVDGRGTGGNPNQVDPGVCAHLGALGLFGTLTQTLTLTLTFTLTLTLTLTPP